MDRYLHRMPRTTICLLLAALYLPASGSAQYVVENAFPDLTFRAPVGIVTPADGTNRLFVLERRGVITVFENRSDVGASETFLNITDRVDRSNREEGLLGLAFHPRFDENGYFYVYYTANTPARTVIARFELDGSDPNRGDPGSEVVLLEFAQPYENHNGGQLGFGPDGMLYVAVGDGGSQADPHGHGQNRETLLGSILRIDVDNPDPGMNYGIPVDNPFAGNTDNFREEIFAYGLRNPWRFSFDMPTGRLWAGDVGQDAFEEIDLIESGKNYGWNIMEASSCFQASSCDQTGLTLPVFEYSQNRNDRSVIGGFVYRGSDLPDLWGKYIFGDFVTGRIWALDETQSGFSSTLLIDTDIGISSFGVDEAGELYICNFGGTVHRLAPEGSANQAPEFTSQPEVAATEDELYEYIVTTTDPDSDPVDVTVPQSPAWLTMEVIGGGSARLAGTPRDADVGDHEVRIDATDGSLIVTQEFVISVAGVNDPPTAPLIIAPADGETVVVQGLPEDPVRVDWEVSTDAEGDPVTYTWQLSGTVDFSELHATVDTDTVTAVELTVSTIAALLDGLGLMPGESVNLFHRVVASDGIDISEGPPSAVTLVRGEVVSTEEMRSASSFELSQNFPNPFQSSTRVEFHVPQATRVTIAVYDVLGREVDVILDAFVVEGRHVVYYQPRDLPSGIYTYRMEAPDWNMTRALTVLR